jgi:hypothetical protein
MKFYNLSNHPSVSWKPEQIQAAREIVGPSFGGVEDVKHPNIDPRSTTEEVGTLAERVCEAIPNGSDVMLMGDFTFFLQALAVLKERGCRIWLATTERNTVETLLPNGDIKKEQVFSFVTFRRAP